MWGYEWKYLSLTLNNLLDSNLWYLACAYRLQSIFLAFLCVEGHYPKLFLEFHFSEKYEF